MSLWTIIPVKPLKRAKSRLAPALRPAQRFELAQAMFRHVLSVAASAPQVAGVLVISRDARALALAREFGAKTVQEGADSNLNPALLRATMVVKSWRADAVLILPADLPLISADDLEAMIDLRDERTMVIATDREEDGTNALLVSPPGAIEYQYGSGSFARHRRLAAAAGLSVAVYRSERIQLDVDVPADLRSYQEMVARHRLERLPSFPLAFGAG